MSETKCNHCTGLACGDECDGKSHATTERTCETCNEADGSDCEFSTGRPCRYYNPRPDAQDADECDKEDDNFSKWYADNELRFAHGQWSEKQIAESAYLEGINRRPSRPMSAEVEKAVKRIGRILSNIESYSDDHHWRLDACIAKDDLKVIIAVIKEKV